MQAESSLIDYRFEIKQFFKSLEKKSFDTWYNYARYIRELCCSRDAQFSPSIEFLDRRKGHDKWFEQILDVAEQFVLLGVNDRRSATARLIEWNNNTTNGGNSASVKLAGVHSLCDWVELTLPWKKINGSAPVMIEPDVKAPSRKAVRQIYDILDLRGRCMVSLNICANRVGAYKWFKMKYLSAIEVDGVKLGKITIYPGEKEQYPSYITPEGMANLSLYFERRERAGEELKPDSPIIRNRFDERVYPVIPFSPQSVKAYFRNWWASAGYPTKFQQEKEGIPGIIRDWPACHGFRKFGETELENAGMTHEVAEIVLGHRYQYKKMQDIDVQRSFVKHMKGLFMSDELILKDEIKVKDERIKSSERDLTAALIIAEKKNENTEKKLEWVMKRLGIEGDPFEVK